MFLSDANTRLVQFFSQCDKFAIYAAVARDNPQRAPENSMKKRATR